MIIIFVLASLAGVAFSNYGQVPVQAPAPYNPPAYPGPIYPTAVHYPGWNPRHRDSRSSRSRSDSRSDSREDKKCHRCDKLKIYKNETLYPGSPISLPNISYSTKQNNCREAIISCPFDYKQYGMYIPYDGSVATLNRGTLIQRVVKCNNNGMYQAIAEVYDSGTGTYNDVSVQFSKVVCIDHSDRGNTTLTRHVLRRK